MESTSFKMYKLTILACQFACFTEKICILINNMQIRQVKPLLGACGRQVIIMGVQYIQRHIITSLVQKSLIQQSGNTSSPENGKKAVNFPSFQQEEAYFHTSYAGEYSAWQLGLDSCQTSESQLVCLPGGKWLPYLNILII